MNLSEFLTALSSIPAVILALFGGANFVLVALSLWLGKVWAARILAREVAELNGSLEVTKAHLVRSIEQEKAKSSVILEQCKNSLQELSSSRFDALTRKREIYTGLATKMRILLASGITGDQIERGKQEFLAAYDAAYLWASENVVSSIRDLIKCLEEKSRITGLGQQTTNNSGDLNSIAIEHKLNDRASQLYRDCLLEMRRDCGFPVSEAEFRLVAFK
jgi:hypothetical protein